MIRKLHPKDDVSIPGDLKAEVRGDIMYLPSDILTKLSDLKLKTDIDLHSYLDVFPSTVANLLDWRVVEVKQAFKVFDTLMAFKKPIKDNVTYGALDPKNLK